MLDDDRVFMQPLDDVDRALWRSGSAAPGTPVHQEVATENGACQALVTVRQRANDETLMLAVGRGGRRAFEDRAERLFQSIFLFAEVALQNMWLLNRVQEKAAALQRKKTLDDLHEKQLSNEAEIARLEEELARLKGEEAPTRGTTPQSAAQKTDAAPPPSAAIKPGPP